MNSVTFLCIVFLWLYLSTTIAPTIKPDFSFSPGWAWCIEHAGLKCAHAVLNGAKSGVLLVTPEVQQITLVENM